MSINVELNLTLRCNAACPGCNRLCDKRIFSDSLSVEQVQQFIEQAEALKRRGGQVKRVKLVGGEPTLHEDFATVYALLAKAVADWLIVKVKIDSNGLRPRPKLPDVPGIRWHTDKPKTKRHLPYTWAPIDLGYLPAGNCSMPRTCGFSLDSRGWLPCSAAIAIVRVFGLEHLYRQEMPGAVWGLDEICGLCIHAMSREWKDQHCLPLAELGKVEPTKSWQEALERYAV